MNCRLGKLPTDHEYKWYESDVGPQTEIPPVFFSSLKILILQFQDQEKF